MPSPKITIHSNKNPAGNQKAELFGQNRENEICMLFRDIIELRLGPFHIALAGPATGPDRDLGLFDLIAIIHDIHRRTR